MSMKKMQKANAKRRLPLGSNPVKGPEVEKKTVKFANGVTVTLANVRKKTKK